VIAIEKVWKAVPRRKEGDFSGPNNSDENDTSDD
jgi:hypothetical protein